MKRTLLILGIIGIVSLALVARLLLKQRDTMEEERDWFVKAVRYEFSAEIDSIKMLNETTGRLYCKVTAGAPKSHREDSLKPLFKEHDMLYLIFKQSGDSIVFLVPENAKPLAKGDSVHVSSEKNIIEFFRDEKLVTSAPLTNTLTGFGRPFFMKGKM